MQATWPAGAEDNSRTFTITIPSIGVGIMLVQLGQHYIHTGCMFCVYKLRICPHNVYRAIPHDGNFTITSLYLSGRSQLHNALSQGYHWPNPRRTDPPYIANFLALDGPEGLPRAHQSSTMKNHQQE